MKRRFLTVLASVFGLDCGAADRILQQPITRIVRQSERQPSRSSHGSIMLMSNGGSRSTIPCTFV